MGCAYELLPLADDAVVVYLYGPGRVSIVSAQDSLRLSDAAFGSVICMSPSVTLMQRGLTYGWRAVPG